MNPWEKYGATSDDVTQDQAPQVPQAPQAPWEKYGAISATAAPAQRTVSEDIGEEAKKGIGRGLATAAGDIGEAIAGPFGPSGHFANLMADIGLGERPKPQPSYSERIIKSAGIEPSPQTAAGRFAGTAGEFLGNPESYFGPGGMVAKGATAIGAGLGSEAAGEFGEKFAPESPRTQALLRFMGGVAGGSGTTMVPRIVTPNIIPAARQAMVATLDREDVPLTAGDRTGGTMLKATESELAPGRNEPQRQAFEQAAFNRVGEVIGDRPLHGPTGAVNTMMNRIGNQFDAIANRNHVRADPQLVQDLHNIDTTYNAGPNTPSIYPQETVGAVNGALERVRNSLNNGNGILSGPDYQDLRSSLRHAAQGATDPQRSEALHTVTNALDDAMERTIQQTNPADAGIYPAVRRAYRNALVLQNWAGAANQTPATLAQAAKNVYGKGAYVRGQDDFSELAQAGREVLKQYQDSGTARRLQVENVLKGIGGLAGAIAGGGAGAGFGGATGAAEGGVLGLLLGENAAPFVARPAARAALMNPATQAYLGGTLPWQAQYRLGTSPTMVSLVNAIRGTPQNNEDQKRLYISPNRGQ